MLPALADTPQMSKSDNSLILVQESFIKASRMPTLTGRIELSDGLGGIMRLDDVQAYLDDKYPEMTNLLMDLIDCESGFNPSKCGDSGVSCGILQIQEQTFKDWSCNGEWKDSENQVDCSVPVIKSGIGSTTEGWYNCWRIKNLFKYGY
jgi:hypothetical protein